jgi:hypothetical protein
MTNSRNTLLIVYNAQSGWLNAMLHALHKAVKPETYPCSLCALTYGTVSMHNDWRRFLDALPLDVAFHHSDDFADDYGMSDLPLPAILTVKAGANPEVLVDSETLDATQNLPALKAKVEEQLTRRFGSQMLAA